MNLLSLTLWIVTTDRSSNETQNIIITFSGYFIRNALRKKENIELGYRGKEGCVLTL